MKRLAAFRMKVERPALWGRHVGGSQSSLSQPPHSWQLLVEEGAACDLDLNPSHTTRAV